jgi:hypothetical protein
MLPQSLLQKMLGTEFFTRTTGDSPNATGSRRAKRHAPGGQQARHRGTSTGKGEWTDGLVYALLPDEWQSGSW